MKLLDNFHTKIDRARSSAWPGDFVGRLSILINSVVPARLGPALAALAWLQSALACKISRPGRHGRLRLGPAWLWPRPRLGQCNFLLLLMMVFDQFLMPLEKVVVQNLQVSRLKNYLLQLLA